VKIESGLSPSDRLVDNPLEPTQTGDKVAIADPEPNAVARASTASPKAAPAKPPSL
jgi:hypothetical protein